MKLVLIVSASAFQLAVMEKRENKEFKVHKVPLDHRVHKVPKVRRVIELEKKEIRGLKETRVKMVSTD